MAERMEVWPVERLKPYERNARTHSADQVAKIAASLVEFGFTNPILVDSKDGIIAGHGRLMAAKHVGMQAVPVIVLDHLTDAQRRAYILADNRLALDAGWDEGLLSEELADLQAEGFDLALTGFSDDELAELLEDDEDGDSAPGDEDAVGAAPDQPVSVPGDIWVLGRHRLMCGDSTSIDAVDRLMDGVQADMVFTDPPYGVSAGGGRSRTVDKLGISAIANDDLRGEALEQFIVDALKLAPLVDGGSFYVCYDQKTQHEFTGALRAISWRQRSTIIWNKNVFGLYGHKGYRPKFELVAFGHTGDSYTWHGDNAQADVWDIPRPKERPGNHPTPKPVELVERAIANSSKKGQRVLDLFGGSGSTLIACEKTRRVSYTMELDPRYVDVIVKRWQEFTGKQAQLEDTGESFADVAAGRGVDIDESAEA